MINEGEEQRTALEYGSHGGQEEECLVEYLGSSSFR